MEIARIKEKNSLHTFKDSTYLFNCCQYFTLIHIANIILSIIP